MTGELVDDDGNPIGYPDPVDVDVTVKLYNDESDGVLLYTETFLAADGQAITVEDGLFVARLGEGTTSDNLRNVITQNSGLWVEITIDDGTPEVLQPRVPLTASAYAIGGQPLLGAQTIYGQGEPSASSEAAIGTFYIDTQTESTWLRIKRGWRVMD